jgi:hypothetical protein
MMTKNVVLGMEPTEAEWSLLGEVLFRVREGSGFSVNDPETLAQKERRIALLVEELDKALAMLDDQEL